MGALGCDDLQVDGRLGRGEFNYLCGEPGDATCDGTDVFSSFDLDGDREIRTLVVGGTFGLEYDDDAAVRVVPLGRDALAFDNGTLSFLSATTVEFMALNGENEVLDFVDLSARDMDGVTVYYDGRAVTDVNLEANRDHTLAAAPTAGGDILGGGLDYQWVLSGSGIRSNSLGSSNFVTLRVDFGATGELTAIANGFTTTVRISTSL
ncbi:MAG: hypothetical protein AAGA56_12060 [Myxococcota bacterium]